MKTDMALRAGFFFGVTERTAQKINRRQAFFLRAAAYGASVVFFCETVA